SYFERSCQRALDLHVEPALERLRDEAAGGEEKNQRRDERKRHEREHEAHAEPRAENALFPLEDELDEISDDQKDEQDEEDDVDVEQEEERDIIRQRIVGDVRRLDLEVGQDHHHQRGDEDDDALAFAALRLFAAQALFEFALLHGKI